MQQEITLYTTTAKGNRVKNKAIVKYEDGRIIFLKSPFGLKDEIKSMKGAKWHGYEAEDTKYWSVEDCQRNRFQLAYLQGLNPYEWFDRPIQKHEYPRKLMSHQVELADFWLTYHYTIFASEPGTGKTLAAISGMELSKVKDWWFVAPRSVLEAIKREFKKWELDPTIKVELLTYEGLVTKMKTFDGKPPQGVVFDESSKLKTATSQRSEAAQKLANLIRFHYGNDGYVLLMSGTPAPKSPVDWWSSAEIAYPGFLKEGSPKALEQRLAYFTDQQFDCGIIKKRTSWKDDENKCNKCGMLKDDPLHTITGDPVLDHVDAHPFEPGINEVQLMYRRLEGLVIVKRKKDCLDLPEKHYRRVYCTPSESTLRAAKALINTSVNAVTGLTLLRELSDGFQYREVKNGTKPCGHCKATGVVKNWYDPDDPDRTYSAIDMLDPNIVSSLIESEIECPVCGGSKEQDTYERIAKEIPTPKEPALVSLLEENEEHGRIVVFAGFTGSVDRCVRICLENNWDVVRCDGRGFTVFRKHPDGVVEELIGQNALDYWADKENDRVAFVAHPESGGMGLTLTEACMVVFWSNTYRPEFRLQSEDRIHRPGADENRGCTIVDLIHLPTDEKALETLRENRRIELLSMNELADALKETVENYERKIAA